MGVWINKSVKIQGVCNLIIDDNSLPKGLEDIHGGPIPVQRGALRRKAYQKPRLRNDDPYVKRLEGLITRLVSEHTRTILIPRCLDVFQPISGLRVLLLSPAQMPFHTTRCSPFGRTGYLPSRISGFAPLHMLPIPLLSQGARPPQSNECHFLCVRAIIQKDASTHYLALKSCSNINDYHHDEILSQILPCMPFLCGFSGDEGIPLPSLSMTSLLGSPL